MRRKPTLMVLTIYAICMSAAADIPKLPHAEPHTVAMRSEHLDRIDELVKDAIHEEKMPGCVVTIGRRGKIAFQRAYGNRQVEPEREPMTVDTVFDLASLTKPIATATSVMILMEQGKLRIRNKATEFLPQMDNHGKSAIRVKQMLLHTSGLKPFLPIERTTENAEAGWQAMYNSELRASPGEQFIYSDINFMLLGKMIERASCQSLRRFSHEHLFARLGMDETGFIPSEKLHERCAPTEQRDGEWIRGEVHDPRAYFVGGIAGHAGLFSTASDLAVYAQMMLGGGSYAGVRILNPRTVELMTSAYDVPRGTRGLGWDKKSPYSSNRGELMSDRAFGHGGFTGTAIWIDPHFDLFVIFLSNRVHPNGKGSVNDLAGRISNIAVAAVERLETRVESSETATEENMVSRDAKAERGSRQQPTANSQQPVGNGIDVLELDEFELLANQRIGLITNHTGHNRNRISTIQLLHEAPNVNLVAIFSPEHGIAGKLDQASIGDARDEQTSLPIVSLYGKSRKPTKAMLEGIDTLVFDIQDIGTRFYTYVSTMGLAMEAAAAQGVRFVVLDRVNPLGGEIMAGPMLDADKESFVGYHPIPIRHGMTVGELARLFRRQRDLDALDLIVVPLEGWRRDMLFDETGLPWTNPSPNMRSLTQALLYPGIGLLETTNLSVGRGTDTPFEVFGAPWIHGVELAMHLNALHLPGVRFVPIQFTPESSKFAEKICHGVNIIVTDREAFQSVRTGLNIASQLRTDYPNDWKVEAYNRLLGNTKVLESIRRGESYSAIENSFSGQLNKFKQHRHNTLIYSSVE